MEVLQSKVDYHSLLASAIAGRRVVVGVTKFAEVYADGETIYLPKHHSHGEQYTVALVVQAALLGCGSLNRKVALRLMGQEAAAARYLTLEAARVAAVAGKVMPRPILELIVSAWSDAGPTESQESLDRALADKSIPPAPKVFGVIRPFALLRWQSTGGAKGNPIAQAEQRQAEDRVLGGGQDDEGEHGRAERSTSYSKVTGPMLGETPASKFLKMLIGAKGSTTPGENSGSGGELEATRVKWVKQMATGAKVISTALGFGGSDISPDGAQAYPEWNHTAGTYRPDWCRVSMYEPVIAGSLHQGSPDRLLRRKLARLGMRYMAHHKQAEGENLDHDALIAYVVDTASGFSGDERIYETRRKTGRDLAVIVLVDASGSTADQQSANASIWEVQRDLVKNIVVALGELGDSVAAYGFRSFGRNDVRFLRIKEFGERFGQGARGRLMALNPSGFTRLGAAIRHSSHLLATRTHTEQQLLVIISDGLPYDMGYEDTHAEQDVRCALDEAEQQGIGCVCLSVGSSRKKEVLERIWGNVGHATLEAPVDLHRYVDLLFRAALKRAASSSSSPGAHKTSTRAVH